MKITCVCIYQFFKIVAGGKPASSLKITPSKLFQEFYSVCFEISKYLRTTILWNTYQCVLAIVEATLKSHLRLKKLKWTVLIYRLMDNA